MAKKKENKFDKISIGELNVMPDDVREWLSDKDFYNIRIDIVSMKNDGQLDIDLKLKGQELLDFVNYVNELKNETSTPN